MAYNESRGLVDAFDGMGDRKKKVTAAWEIQRGVLRRSIADASGIAVCGTAWF